MSHCIHTRWILAECPDLVNFSRNVWFLRICQRVHVDFFRWLELGVMTQLMHCLSLIRYLHKERGSYCILFGQSSFSFPSSETQGLLAGKKRYFRAEVYFKSWRAPGNLFLPNQFQKWSNSVPLTRKIFFWLISQEVQLGNSVAFLHKVVFFIDRPAWPVQWEDSRGEFQKKKIQRNQGNRKP